MCGDGGDGGGGGAGVGAEAGVGVGNDGVGGSGVSGVGGVGDSVGGGIGDSADMGGIGMGPAEASVDAANSSMGTADPAAQAAAQATDMGLSSPVGVDVGGTGISDAAARARAPLGILGILSRPNDAIAALKANPIGYPAALSIAALAAPPVAAVVGLGQALSAIFGGTPSTDNSVDGSGNSVGGVSGTTSSGPGASGGGGFDPATQFGIVGANPFPNLPPPGGDGGGVQFGSNNNIPQGVNYLGWGRGLGWNFDTFSPTADRRGNITGGLGSRIALI